MARSQIEIEEVESPYDYSASREKLVQDFKVVVADAEEMLRATANQANEKVAEARVKFAERLDIAKTRLAEAENMLRGKGAEAQRATEFYVQEHPWKAVGIASGVGFLLGLLVNRR